MGCFTRQKRALLNLLCNPLVGALKGGHRRAQQQGN